jgi:hypothetical protein
MRRNICITEPAFTHAGQEGLFKFTFVPALNLPKKSKLLFVLNSDGQAGSWQIPQTNLKKGENTIWLQIHDKVIAAKSPASTPIDHFEFILTEDVKAGEKLFIFMGTANATGDKARSNHAQHLIQRKRAFTLFVDPKGKGVYKEPENFTIDIRGNILKNIKIITPSIVFKNDRFDIVVRFEDAYSNLTGNAVEGTLVELSYTQLRENLKWKLFVPETGFLSLPNIYFNEPGIYTIELTNLQNKEKFYSAPICCYKNKGEMVFWGQLHSDSTDFKNYDEIEMSLRSARDKHALQFFSTSCNENVKSTSSEEWKIINTQVAEFNEEERFVTMLGFQWSGKPNDEGARQFIYAKDNRALLRKSDTKSNQLKKIYNTHSEKELISIPSMTMVSDFAYNFKNFNPEFERVVEIYNGFGSSECSTKKGNTYPLKTRGIKECDDGSIIEALNNNLRFGFVAGGLNRQGFYKDLLQSRNEYSQGLTAILALEYSRETLFQALYDRKCYATTGERIIVTFHIANLTMGSESSTAEKPGFLFNRNIHGQIAGCGPFKKVSIIRNGQVIHSYKNMPQQFNIDFDDEEPFEKVVLKGGPQKKPFAYYYMRAERENGQMAWSSPIWIDLEPPLKKVIK